MRACRPLCASYRLNKILDCARPLLSKKAVEYDYVAVDATTLVSTALRLARGVEQRRLKEVARLVAQSLRHLLQAKVRATKSILVVLDGAETLHKAATFRVGPLTRRQEGRLAHLPGTAVMQMVEDRLVRMLPDRAIVPAEVVFAGTCVAGGAEEKISAWALDVATGDGFRGGSQSLCLVGSGELVLNAIALSPYFHCSSAVFASNEVRHIPMNEVLQWLEVDGLLDGDRAHRISTIRTDALLLMLMEQGCSATELSSLADARFSTLYALYYDAVVASDVDAPDGVLFTNHPNHTLSLNLAALLRLLPSSKPHHSNAADDYLEHLLQSHALLTLGTTPHPSRIFSYLNRAQRSACPVNLGTLASHVAYVVHTGQTHRVAEYQPQPQHINAPAAGPFTQDVQPMTAAEFTILSQNNVAGVEALMQQYIGLIPTAEVGKQLTQYPVPQAKDLLRELLRFASPDRPHRATCLSPAYCWRHDDVRRMWSMSFVDIGEVSRQASARYALASAEVEVCVQDSQHADSLVAFDATTNQWSTWRPTAKSLTSSSATTTTTPSTSFKVLTWNVMFDRYSGQPTPLGMPGINWCSPQRYPVLSSIIAAEDADVVGLQEVEPAFWAYLAEQPWCRERYILSCSESGQAITPWGVLMLVHKRRAGSIREFMHRNVPAWSSHLCLMPVVTLGLGTGGEVLHVAATHLLAPFTPEHERARVTQDENLRRQLIKQVVGDCLIMGDFNDWPKREFTMPPTSRYVDCWPLLHPQHPGKTMDESNPFCRLKIEEMFFGRADKMFLRSSRWRPVEAHLVGTRSVNDELGNHEAPDYLFPSDHYGVCCTFDVAQRM